MSKKEKGDIGMIVREQNKKQNKITISEFEKYHRKTPLRKEERVNTNQIRLVNNRYIGPA